MSNPQIDAAEIISGLTERQLQTLAMIGEGRTHKEIAGTLEIGNSAVAQRVASLRNKFGGVSKQELGRIYREYASEDHCNILTGVKSQLPDPDPIAASETRHQAGSQLDNLDNAPIVEIDALRLSRLEPRVVPEVLDSDYAVSFRWAAVVGIAVGLLAAMVLALSAAQAIGALRG